MKRRDQYEPSHIALSCSGDFAAGGVGVGDAFSSVGIGLTSSPTVLGILAVPSIMAEKSIPMNRKIMSCVTCGKL